MDTTFQQGTVITHEWLNDVNSHVNNKNTVEHSADKISFVQSDIGAVQRTTQDKLREFVSVKDFGAVGDGVTDDTAALNKIAAAAQGKAVHLNGKTYYIADENL